VSEMINAVLKWLSALLCVLLLYMYPLTDSLQRQADIEIWTVTRSVHTFADAVRHKGYVSPQMVEDFQMELAATRTMYSFEMEHYQQRYEPIYEDPVRHETFANEYMIRHMVTSHEDIIEDLFPTNLSASDNLTERRYSMKPGDYFYVQVQRLQTSGHSILMSWMTGAEHVQQLPIAGGGMVRNETR